MSVKLERYFYRDGAFVYEYWFSGKYYMRRLYSYLGMLNLTERGFRCSKKEFLEHLEGNSGCHT